MQILTSRWRAHTAALVVGAVAVTAFATGGAGGADASAPRTAVQARKAGPPPAWLKALRAQAVLHTRHGQVVAVGPDPRLATGVGTTDVAGWARRRALEKAAAEAAGAGTASPLSSGSRGARPRPNTRPAAGKNRIQVTEKEAAGSSGGNDTLATAQSVKGFGTVRPARNAADVVGVQSPGPVPPLTRIPRNVEDDGTPETAGVTGVSTKHPGARTTGFIGDNPKDPADPGAPDFDVYALDLTAGQLFTARLRVTSGDLQPLLFLVDPARGVLADSFSDPDFLNPSASAPAQFTGRYYVVATGFELGDETTGSLTPTKGDYTLDIWSRRGDRDVYKVALAAGDVLGTNVSGAGRIVTLLDAKGTELTGSSQDASSAYPANTPLPGGGNATADTVAPRKGTYFVAVSGGEGPYVLNIEAYRPGGTRKVSQTIFLDYDGQRLNTNIYGGRGVTTLSPLADFLPAWGLKASDRKAVGRAIKATVVENLQKDLVRSGLSSTVSVKVVTSDEVKDPFGAKGVTRIVVGGTIEESGVDTIGIAQDIDPGNFFREETALVLLDSLSLPGSPADPENSEPFSLNTYLGPGSNRVKFVGQAVGNVASHEAGHLLGNFHTDNNDARVNLMDAGGDSQAAFFGVGPDGLGGTADDTDTDFVKDTFSPFEGFTGTEDTTARTTWALSR